MKLSLIESILYDYGYYVISCYNNYTVFNYIVFVCKHY